MLRSLEGLIGYDLKATDGSIGEVKDFLFDDKAWVLRYLVADTGKWLPGRKVLIVPAALGEPDWQSRKFPVGMTQQQVKESPDLGEDQPVSEQHQIDIHRHFAWDPYWVAYAGYAGPLAFPTVPPGSDADLPPAAETQGDPHLRSVREVTGYHIAATDGEIGHVEDFVVDEEGWIIRYVVVDTRNWLPGKKVLVSPEWFDSVSWADRKVFVDLTKESVRNSPAYDPHRPVNREEEGMLYDYYGRPAYWMQSNRPAGATVGHW